MSKHRVSELVATLALCATSFAVSAQQTTYRVTHVWTRQTEEPHTNDEFEITGINDRGHLAGFRVPLGAFVWRNGTFENLGPPDSIVSWAFGINDWSNVAGMYADTPDSARGFLWRSGQFVPVVGQAGEQFVDAIHLNNRREVLILSIHAQNGARYFLWRRTGAIELQGLPGMGAGPVRINDAGVVVGTASGAGNSVPVIWQGGAIMSIGLPDGATGGSGRDINDAGTVALDVTTNAPGNATYLWYEGVFTRLPALDGYPSTSAAAINNAAVVVGAATGPTVSDTAIVWTNGEVGDLNALVHPNDPLKPFLILRRALHINDRGEIVVRGIDTRNEPSTVSHYLLTPRY